MSYKMNINICLNSKNWMWRQVLVKWPSNPEEEPEFKFVQMSKSEIKEALMNEEFKVKSNEFQKNNDCFASKTEWNKDVVTTDGLCNEEEKNCQISDKEIIARLLDTSSNVLNCDNI